MKYTILLLLIFILGCKGNPSDNNAQNEGDTKETRNVVVENQIPPAILKRGEEVYNTYCIACHMSDGTGNPGMYPPLDQTDWVNGDKERLIGIILNGMSGPVEVKGETYNQVMVPHNFLTDMQIADVLTYIRNSFGNNSSRVTSEEVRKVRNQ